MVGTMLAHYEILEPLGAGGMGEVYRARDTRLDRDVALKVLPETMAADAERRARFEREAKAIAALDHPNIVTIHSVEEAALAGEGAPGGEGALGGEGAPVLFITMQLVDGKALSDLIPRQGLSLEPFFGISVQLADAVGAAHERGITHRDLKPSNVMVSGDGRVKVLDFGLAKLREERSAEPATELPTQHVTEEGRILGTVAYMSPEQAEGKPVDHRSDIFSLGILLYEMATGEQPFRGDTRVSVLSSIVKDVPVPVTERNQRLPRHLGRIVRRCLEKDPGRRYQSAVDLRNELEDLRDEVASGEALAVDPGAGTRASEKTSGRLLVAAAMIAAVSTLLALGLILERGLQAGDEDRPVEFEINAPSGTSFSTWRRGRPVISPDGGLILFSAVGSSGERLWVRSLDSLEARPLPGTEDGREAFWSADSRHVAFSSASGVLRRVDVNGGPPRSLAEWLTLGGTWNGADDVLLSSFWQSIHRTSAAAGEGQRPRPLTTLDPSRQEIWHAEPEFLPDGEHFLFFVDSREAEHTGTYVASLTSPDSRQRVLAGARASYADPGYILFTQAESLFARRFEVERLQPVGDPELVAERVAVVEGRALFSTSSNRTLAYRVPFASDAQLTWFDRQGNALGVLSLPEGAQNPELSPNEELLAFERIDPETGWRDIWLWDFGRGVAEKLTNHPSNDSDPVWAADGSSIIYSSQRNGYPSLHRRQVGSSAAPEMIRDAQGEDWPMSWSRDGRHLIYTRWSAGELRGKLMVLSLSGDQEPTPLLGSGSEEHSGQFSPDGKWVAYVTSESGGGEVYVEPFPQTGEKWKVSAAGGSDPRWRGDGEELYYLDPERKLMAVAMSLAGAGLGPSAPQELFQTRISGPAGVGVRFNYDVSSDGQRFLINTDSGERRPSPIVVVVNWTARLRR